MDTPQNTPNISPAISPLGQYLTDLSFENFARDSTGTANAVQVGVNVDARALSQNETGTNADGDYESMLMLNITARPVGADGQIDTNAKPIFIIELRYAGRYRFQNISATDREPFLLIEAPRLLFPFVRQIVAETASQGGFPSLLLAPIDFVQVYQQRKAAAA